MKIDETMTKVDSILDSIKDLKIGEKGSKKKRVVNTMIDRSVKAEIKSEKSQSKNCEELPKFSLRANDSYNPLEMIKKSVPPKTLKIYQMTKNLENNIANLSS